MPPPSQKKKKITYLHTHAVCRSARRAWRNGKKSHRMRDKRNGEVALYRLSHELLWDARLAWLVHSN